jgi:hypothetical protein
VTSSGVGMTVVFRMAVVVDLKTSGMAVVRAGDNFRRMYMMPE